MSAAARRERLSAIYRRALAAVDPGPAVRRALDDLPELAGGPCVVLAAGKAAAAMAAAAETALGTRLRRGLAVTRDGHGLPLERCALREAGHPLPDARSAAAGRAALALAASVEPDETLLVLLSGGASALLSTPLPGLEHEDLAAATRALLAAGADIDATNTVRKHLGAVGGGRLARAAARAARIVVLAISDVAGDRLDVIGSGPCAADPSSWRDVVAVLERLGLRGRLPPAVEALVAQGARGALADTPKPGDPALARVRHRVVASNRDALEGARVAAAQAGLRPVLVTHALAGEARVAGRRLAGLARAVPPGAGACLLAGGETTVRVRGPGRGGRSQELALAAALEWDRRGGGQGLALLAAGTDGSDGPTDAAGAFADPDTVARGRAAGRDARADLDANDSYAFFDAEGGLLRTGPTRTNVMDLVLASVD